MKRHRFPAGDANPARRNPRPGPWPIVDPLDARRPECQAARRLFPKGTLWSSVSPVLRRVALAVVALDQAIEALPEGDPRRAEMTRDRAWLVLRIPGEVPAAEGPEDAIARAREEHAAAIEAIHGKRRA